VTAERKADKVEMIQIKSLYGGELQLLSPWQNIEAYANKDQDFQPLHPDQRGVVSVQTKAGEEWVFRGSPPQK
jgi:hypothetical protein